MNYGKDGKVTVANNQKVAACEHGNVHIKSGNKSKVISDIILVPELKTNLLSVSKIVEKGHSNFQH